MAPGLGGRSHSRCPANGRLIGVYWNLQNLFAIIGRRELC
jgi:hypothetical protein